MECFFSLSRKMMKDLLFLQNKPFTLFNFFPLCLRRKTFQLPSFFFSSSFFSFASFSLVDILISCESAGEEKIFSGYKEKEREKKRRNFRKIESIFLSFVRSKFERTNKLRRKQERKNAAGQNNK